MRGLEQIAGHRLLFLNWRDQANPEAGGAEAYTEEIARRLAAAGAEVTLFTGKYPGAAPFDWAREYLVAREGGRFGVRMAPVLSDVRRLLMQGLLASIFGQVAEMGVFFAAAAALVAGALMLR